MSDLSPYQQAHDRLTAYMRANGLKITRQRELILHAFLDAKKHLTVEELLQIVRAREAGIGHATVYRTVRLFVQAGIASEHHFTDGASLYEPDGEGEEDHHDHLICSDCGRILEFENEEIERLQEQVARALGFRLKDHRMELFGACLTPSCPYAPSRRR